MKPLFELDKILKSSLLALSFAGVKAGLKDLFLRLSHQTLNVDHKLARMAAPELNRILQKIMQNFFYQAKLIEERFKKDFNELEETFGPLGQIIDIKGPCSDLHDNHAAVFFVYFENQILVYKPRRLLVDRTYFELCQFYLGQPKVRFVLRESYGWMEFLTADHKEPAKAYPLGQNIALLTLLRSSDHHLENIITLKGCPQFIDLECSLAPEMTFAPRQDQIFQPQATRAVPDLNSEDFELFKKGFEDSWKQIEENKSEILNKIKSLRLERMRVVLRQTKYYQELLEASFHPELLIDSKFRLRCIKEHLMGGASGFEGVADYEARCLCEGQIPKFVYQANQKLILANEFTFDGLISESGYDLALKHLQQGIRRTF